MDEHRSCHIGGRVKVCHITSVHTTLDTRIFHKECKTLKQAGYDVTLVAQADWKERIVDGVRVIGLPRVARRYQRLRLWRYIVKEVKKLKPDVVHFHDPELLLIAPCFRPAKLIYDCHEPYAEAMLLKMWIPDPLRHPMSEIVALLEPTLARLTDAIVTTVHSHAAPFRHLRQPKVIVHNFPLLNDFKSANHSDGKTIIHLGTQTKPRGSSLAVEVMKQVSRQFPEARLLLVGPFEGPEYENEVRQMIAAYRLEKNVELTGRVPYTDVPRWLARADVGIVVLQNTKKFNTGIPVKLLEYMGSRLPVVASDLPGARQVMGGLECGYLVKPGAPQEFAEAVEYLLSHPTEAARMGENGRRATEERYNWELEGRKLVDLYQKLG